MVRSTSLRCRLSCASSKHFLESFVQSLGLVHMWSRVLSPMRVNKSQHEDKVTTFELQEAHEKHGLVTLCLLYANKNYLSGLVS
jgi:hypothetical protein